MSTFNFGTAATSAPPILKHHSVGLHKSHVRREKQDKNVELQTTSEILGKTVHFSSCFPEALVRICSGDYDSGYMSHKTFIDEMSSFISQESGHVLIGMRPRTIRAGVLKILFAGEVNQVEMTAAACTFIIFYAYQLYMWIQMSNEDPVEYDLKIKTIINTFALDVTLDLPYPFNMRGPLRELSLIRLATRFLEHVLDKFAPNSLRNMFQRKPQLMQLVLDLWKFTVIRCGTTERVYSGPVFERHMDIQYSLFMTYFAYMFLQHSIKVVMRRVCGVSRRMALFYSYIGLLERSKALGKISLTNFVPETSKNYGEGGTFLDVISMEYTDPKWEMVIVNFPEGHSENAEMVLKTCKTQDRDVYNPNTNDPIENTDDTELYETVSLSDEIDAAVKLYKKTEKKQVYNAERMEWVDVSETQNAPRSVWSVLDD